MSKWVEPVLTGILASLLTVIQVVFGWKLFFISVGFYAFGGFTFWLLAKEDENDK